MFIVAVPNVSVVVSVVVVVVVVTTAVVFATIVACLLGSEELRPYHVPQAARLITHRWRTGVPTQIFDAQR